MPALPFPSLGVSVSLPIKWGKLMQTRASKDLAVSLASGALLRWSPFLLHAPQPNIITLVCGLPFHHLGSSRPILSCWDTSLCMELFLVQANSSPLLIGSYEDVPWSALVHLATVRWPSFLLNSVCPAGQHGGGVGKLPESPFPVVGAHAGMPGPVERNTPDHHMNADLIDATPAILLRRHHAVCPFPV